MKTFRFDYKGYGNFPSWCMIHYTFHSIKYIIVFENGEGTSVTNMSEQLATDIVKKLGLKHEECLFFEKYPENDYIDQIFYTWKNNIASNPKWKRVEGVKIINDLLK